VSGFDFDALRDPDAPQPGAPERARVDVRAAQLRARTRRTRFATSATSIVAVVAIVLAVVAARNNRGPQIVVGGGSTTTITTPTSVAPSVDDRFIPPTTVQSGLVALPVTLPDGETFTLRYPPAMKIAQLGFAGGGGVVGFSGVSSRQVTIGYTNVQRVYGDTPPRSIFHDANGNQVSLYSGSDQNGRLAFQFGPWLVQVADDNYAMTNSQLETWARNLTGTVDANGYLVLHAKAPLSVANWFDGGFGSFDKGNLLELADHLYCGQPESDTSKHRRFTNGNRTHGVSWCDADLHVVATGTPSFVDLADRQLQVSASTPPVGETTTTIATTTTTAPVAGNTQPALSASFVSPNQGWVLQRDGRIDTTADGGAIWKVLGQLANHDPDTKIRFADSKRGFAFNTRYFFTTSDGGSHWSVLHAPFSDVLDLEISRGVAYAVTFPPSASGSEGFTLWSSPTDRLAWSKSPLVLGIGAGGDPSEQLVFARGSGWVLDVMRTVIGGGRLAASGQWNKWNPPCLDVEGPAYLTASTADDVVATCDEGVWGGNSPKVTPAISFSHDGGVTFQRHDAPGFGPVASPNPTTAVVAATGGLQRTTDSGATWRSVFADPQGFGADDLGFTTATQGFAILGDGQMLMTYDAGATWQRARLP